jgi:hypothetical protein
MQAQAPNPPYIGLWTRVARFTFDELAQLVRDRRVVRLAMMRSTIHLVTASDAHRVRPLLQPMLEQAFKSSAHAKLLDGLDLATLAVSGQLAVDEQPRTFAELGAVLSRQWPDRDPSALAQGVRTRIPLVQVPPRGIWGESGQARHTSLDAWVGPPREASASSQDLVLRYLAAFGPAGVNDVQVWSGLTRMREVIDMLRPQLITFRDGNGIELFDLPDAPRPDPDTAPPVRFLPEFDNILLSHSDRRRIVSDTDRGRLFTVNGIIPGSVLVDGFVRAFWKIRSSRREATLSVTPLRPLAKRDVTSITTEGQRLLAVAAPTATSHALVIETS